VKKMTKENLSAAFAGESQAHMRYLVFAAKAEEEKKPNVARLFRAASLSEQRHATNHLRALDGVKATGDNLQAALGGETFEIDEMYPSYVEVAQSQGEAQARTSMEAALAAEKVHAQLFGQAIQALVSGGDLKIADIYVCSHCGFTMIGTPPDKCPICNTPREKFDRFQ